MLRTTVTMFVYFERGNKNLSQQLGFGKNSLNC